jgi:hypothetical protein
MVDDSVNVAVGVSPFKPHLYASDSALQFKTGLRSARASDAKKLKELAAQLASTTVAPIPIDPRSRTGRGFNNNELGRMLIPIDYLEAYDNDPIGYVPKFSTFAY